MKKALLAYFIAFVAMAFFGVVGPSLLSAQNDAAVLVFFLVTFVAGLITLMAVLHLISKLNKEKK